MQKKIEKNIKKGIWSDFFQGLIDIKWIVNIFKLIVDTFVNFDKNENFLLDYLQVFSQKFSFVLYYL